jgi:hypothetical protein
MTTTRDPTESEECWGLVAAWGIDAGSNMSFKSLQELLTKTASQVGAGATVYFGRRRKPDPMQWINPEDVIEQLECRAYDCCGEIAEDYPKVSAEAKAELKHLLSVWARKHCAPTWFMVDSIEPYEITEEDILHCWRLHHNAQ